MARRNRHQCIALSLAGIMFLAGASRLPFCSGDGCSNHCEVFHRDEGSFQPLADVRFVLFCALFADDPVSPALQDLFIDQKEDRWFGSTLNVLRMQKVRSDTSWCRLILDAPKQGPPTSPAIA